MLRNTLSRCLFHKYTTSRSVGATLVVARDWAGTRPAPTGAGLTKWTSSVTSRSFCLVVATRCDLHPSQTEAENSSDDFNVTTHEFEVVSTSPFTRR